ncbi:RidA family protein [Streptomyces sp. 110]|uniref:RidA family protein n=1 Tax=Streptomyces endocoffeicus TaxID=2898945 RepID=A0ABS1Q599_9ACTN|nr:RidA family protein [Streptomyces endocoffeicus]MBL1119837.1 RidA family protein [Streptomyces endocoffeicus]
MTAEPGLVRELIRLASTPQGAPYSAAVAFGEMVPTSGALPVEPNGTVADDFATQVRTALRDFETHLEAAGADRSTLVKINAYVADIDQLPTLNEVYIEVMCRAGASARASGEVSRFRGATKVEFDAVAYRRQR